MISQENTSQRAGNILPAIVLTCLFLGLLTYLATSISTTTESAAGFLQIAVALAALAYLLTFVDIRLGLAMMILCIGLSPEVTLGGFQNLRLEDFLVPALLLAWILRSTRSREDVTHNPIAAPLWIYLGIALLAGLWGVSMETTQFTTTALIIGKNLIFILIFLIILNHIRSYQEFKAFVIFTLLVSLASAMTNSPLSSAYAEVGRIHGPYGETGNIFGGYLIMHVCVFLGLFLHLPTVRGRMISLLASLPLLYTLLFTFSRTSYASLAVAVSFFALFKHRRLVAIVLLAMLIFPLVTPEGVINRAATIFAVADQQGERPASWDARVSAWESSTNKIFDRPLLGAGPGSVPFGWVDNEYVRVAVDMGVIGLVVFLWLLFTIGIRANRIYNILEGPGIMKGYAAGYLMALVAIIVHGSGATSFTAIRTMETFMVLTAFMVVLLVRHKEWIDAEKEEVRQAIGSTAMRAMQRSR